MPLRSKFAAFVVSAAAATGIVAQALPASAATSGNTTATFTLTGGALSITTPASKSLGSAATGSATTSAQLGTVSVSDARGALLGSWTTSVSSSDFTTGAATTNETITKGNAEYWSGTATATSGTGTFTPGQLLAANAQALSSSITAFSASAVVGNNSASWNPTVVVNIPSAAVAGVYTGTITHSVA